jgi:sterol desaturase/sphingolipid hydroxylase (fatty acid hydroxylase superfamily)
MTRNGLFGTVAAIAGIAALLYFERKRPLRRAVEPGPRRVGRNVAVGALTAATVSAVERPLVTRLARVTEERRWGLVNRLPFSAGVRTAIAVLLMDYTLYWWHVLLHRIPHLWRDHVPHHIDRDLDTSTGIRFHFLEFIASVPWRCAQVLLIGVGPRELKLWQQLTLAEVLFHHSNVRLPLEIERVLTWFVVTPRMHGIHHSVVREERDSNFSSGLTLWDRLHGTGNFDIERDDPVIGLPEDGRPGEVRLFDTLALPFKNE